MTNNPKAGILYVLTKNAPAIEYRNSNLRYVDLPKGTVVLCLEPDNRNPENLNRRWWVLSGASKLSIRQRFLTNRLNTINDLI